MFQASKMKVSFEKIKRLILNHILGYFYYTLYLLWFSSFKACIIKSILLASRRRENKILWVQVVTTLTNKHSPLLMVSTRQYMPFDKCNKRYERTSMQQSCQNLTQPLNLTFSSQEIQGCEE